MSYTRLLFERRDALAILTFNEPEKRNPFSPTLIDELGDCLGKVVGGTARVYNSRAQAFAILKRDPHATPVIDVLTYYVDLMCWFLEGNRPVEVVARGQHGIFKEAGYGAHDVTWAIVTFADGAVVNFGVSYALPAGYPTLGQSDRVELLGTEGTMMVDDDHKEHMIYTEKGVPHPYVPGHSLNMAFLGSNSAGDWALVQPKTAGAMGALALWSFSTGRLQNDFALQEFLDRHGMRLGQLGHLLNLLGPLSEACKSRESAQEKKE